MPQDNNPTAEKSFNKDSLANTFITATMVCLVCSFLVSAAAVGLKEMQDTNKALDKKKNILVAAGFDEKKIAETGIDELFATRFETRVINLDTGAEALDELVQKLSTNESTMKKFKTVEDVMAEYDSMKIAKDRSAEALNKPFEEKKDDIAGLGYGRENYAFVYLLKTEDGESVEKYVFPIRGLGLWSTLRGFIAVENDFNTVAGLTYYSHAETPGLGGEVDNPSWKALWKDKKIYSGDNVALKVVKGTGDDEYSIDGLSGATITSSGVSNMIEFWLGEQGYRPFIETQKNKNSKP